MKKIKLLFVLSLFTLVCAQLSAKGDSYTYNFWDDIEKAPDAYRVSHVVYAADLKLDKALKNPSSLFAVGNKIYVADTDNNRFLELEYTDKKTLELKRVIDRVNPSPLLNGVETFNMPKDIFVSSEDGAFYFADSENGRVIKTDADLNVLTIFKEPEDSTYEKGKAFLPAKVVADSKGRVYLLSKNVNKGFLKYESDGSFQGYYGATKVIVNVVERFWKKFATEAQKARMTSFVPTEYSNCYIDKYGFIYAVTQTFSEWDLLSGDAAPIRRLNALGNDFLVQNGYNYAVGDLKWGDAGGIKGPSRMSDITVLDNEIYVALDENRGRLFAYDNQGYLLFAFGGRGNVNGSFRKAASIEHIGKDLFVLDSVNASITVFTPTEYGNLIYQATEQYSVGEYDASAETWAKVLEHNGNYDLAYIGLGKSFLRQNRYKEAMEYFKLKRDRRDYSKAFKYYRKEWIEKHIGWITGILIAAIVIWLVRRTVKRIKWEISTL